MTAITKVDDAQKLKADLTHPLYRIPAQAAQAKADGKALDDALGTACLSAVKRHLAAEEQIGADETGWSTSITTFFVTLVGLLKVIQKEKGKPREEQTHGQHLKDARSLLSDAERDLVQLERTLAGWERARSDIVTALAAAKKALPKNADAAVKTGTAAAKKVHQSLVTSEADLRVWAFKQGEAIAKVKKQIHERRGQVRVIRGILDSIPDALSTPV